MKNRHNSPRSRYYLAAVIAAMALLPKNSAYAAVTDDRKLIEGAKLCTIYLPRHEREYGIPVHLLAAIASTESGRYNKQIGLSLPWPWTVNVEGKGYFFDTKEEAIAAVKQFQRRGYQSIDVGCMQVNLHHHPGAFASLEQAFEPAYNIAYAAQFLKRNFDDEGSWRKATGDYHSRTPVFGGQYARLVFSAWSHIINKVADARAGRLNLKTEAPTAVASDTPSDVKKPNRHTYYALHMHSVAVSRDTARENGVLVIRPQHGSAEAPPKAVQAKVDVEPASGTAGPTLKSNNALQFTIPEAAAAQQPVQEQPQPQAQQQPQQQVQQQTQDSNKGAQVIKLHATQSAARGQFDPSAHNANANAEAAKSGKPDNVFVFDN